MSTSLIIIIAVAILGSFVAYQKVKFDKRFPKKELNNFKIYPFQLASLNTQEMYILKLINQYRLHSGLSDSILKADLKACQLAIQRCNEMIEENELSHLKWTDEASILIQLGSNSVGENIAYGYNSAEAVVNAWIRSEAHKKNIIREDWEYLGIGIVKSNNRYWYCTLFLTS